MALSASIPVTPIPSTEKVPGFFGREAELAWLRRLWDEAATRDRKGSYGGPRLALVVAETGLGKSRLVQELYQVLTSDPVWNPPDKSYWPPTIVTETGQIRLNPPLDDHVPGGPPRFLWLGERWQPIDEPNVQERVCVIPGLRDALYVHVSIAQRHRTTWQRLRTSAEKTIKSEGPDIVKDKALDLTGIPYAGLVLKLVQAGLSTRNAPRTVLEAFQKQQDDAADTLLEEMREVFGGLGGGGLKLPTVLWLDDAHWIDPITLRFLHRLWKEATEKRWPLLVVLTHFEREWNELRIAGKEESLWGLLVQAHAEPIFLTPAPTKDLEARLIETLPGLLPAQRTLILQKAGGNFLTLVQNLGALMHQSAYFEGQRIDGPLTLAGERRVASWELKRDKQIEQQFLNLEPEIQNTLAWATNAAGRAATWFMPDILAMFEARRGMASDTPERKIMENYVRHRKRLASCVYPLAVLGVPSPNILEFRDGAYYRVAREYFKSGLAETEKELVNTYRGLLAFMINETFDERGNLRTVEKKTNVEKMEVSTMSFLGWQIGEMREQLNLAIREFPVPQQPNWNNIFHRAALRAILLYLQLGVQHDLRPVMREHGPKLRAVKWEDVPSDVMSADILLNIGGWLFSVGLPDVAGPMVESFLMRAEKEAKPDSPKLIEILTLLSQIRLATYSFAAAEPLINRLLQLQEQTLGPDSPGVADSLNLLAHLCMDLSRDKDAEKHLLRAREIHERAFGKDAPETSTTIQLDLGTLYINFERYNDAEKLFRHLLAIEQKINPESPRAARIFSELGIALGRQSNYTESESMQRRALAIQERNFGPDQPEVVPYLNRLALVLQDQGRDKDAEAFLKRALDVAEGAFGPTHLEVAEALCMLAYLYLGYDEAGLARPDRPTFTYPKAAAEPLLVRAIDIMDRSSGDAELLGNRLIILGNIYIFSKRDDEAYGVILRALSIREQVPGPDDPEILEPIKDLMEICQRLGQFEVAEAFCKRMLTILEDEQKLGPDSPEWEIPLNLAARLYMEMGRYDEAEKYLLRARSILERAFGKDGPELTTVKEDLGRVYMDLGRYDDAEAQFRSLLAIELGNDPESPRAATVLSNLGIVLRRKQKYDEAESRHRQALAIQERNLGPDPTELVTTLENLARVLRDQGRDKEAEPLLKRSLDILEKIHGPMHHTVADELSNLAFMYLGNANETLAAHIDRQAIREDIPGTDPLDARKSQSHVVETLTRQGRLDAAQPLFLRAIAIREGSPDRLSLTEDLIALGKIHRERQNDDEAYDVLIRALVILDHELDADDNEIFLRLVELMGICVRLDQFEVAEAFCTRMLAILEDNPDQDPLVTAGWLEYIAPLYQVLGNDNQAQAYLQRAQEIRKNSAKSGESE